MISLFEMFKLNVDSKPPSEWSNTNTKVYAKNQPTFEELIAHRNNKQPINNFDDSLRAKQVSYHFLKKLKLNK